MDGTHRRAAAAHTGYEFEAFEILKVLACNMDRCISQAWGLREGMDVLKGSSVFPEPGKKKKKT